MDSVRLYISEKNIPIPTREVYQKMLINAVGIFSKNIRWAAYFFLHPEERPPIKDWYGFKSLSAPPKVKYLDKFEDGLSELVETVEFICHKTSLRILGDSVYPWNNLFGDSVKKRKTTRDFSGICTLFPVVQ